MQTEFHLTRLVEAATESRPHLLLEVRDPGSLALEIPVQGARALDQASETHLTFCRTESPTTVAEARSTRSKFVVCRPQLAQLLPTGFEQDHVLVLTNQPGFLMALLMTPFDSPPAINRQEDRVNPKAEIAETAELGPGVVIGPDVTIARECRIGPNTVVDHATIGEGTQIAFNSSVGSDGFSYETDEITGEVVKFPHFGRVRIGRRVVVSSNCGIARGSLRDTIIEDDVKLDNLVHVAHNCHVKRGAMLTANTMLAGSVTVGEYVWLGPSTAVINSVSVGDLAMTGIGAVVTKPVAPNELAAGVPARRLRDRFAAYHPMLQRQPPVGS